VPPKLRHEPRKHPAFIRSDPWCDATSPCVVEGSGVPFEGFVRDASPEPTPACAQQIGLLTAQSHG